MMEPAGSRRLIRALTATVILVLATGLGATAYGQCMGNYSDDFEDGDLPVGWTPTTGCVAAIETGGQLKTARSLGCANYQSRLRMDPSQLTVCGDFDISVDFELVSFPVPSSGGIVAKGDDVHESVLRRLQGPIADGQVVVHRATSLEAAASFEDGALDWVFLDANHGYAGMKQDLAAWSPKVRPGGYVTDHDYADVKGYGVIQAVDEFARTFPVRMVAKTQDEYASFILRKEASPR